MPSKLREVYILRHGIAADHGSFSKDSERPLTEEGQIKTGKIARAMKGLELSFDLILSSPYVRARETAEIVAREMDLEKRLKFSDHLMVGGDPVLMIREINKDYREAQSILLVGHEPYLSGLISVLSAGSDMPICVLKKAGFAKLSLASEFRYGRCAYLEWLLTPRQMLAMA